MSTLYASEEGRVVPALCEELTTYRRVRKVLELPPTAGPATLYVLARVHGAGVPLRLAVNGRALEPLSAAPEAGYRWLRIPLESSLLVAGANSFELWTDAGAMDAWSLALEAGHAAPHSFLSDDGGASWRRHSMGYLNVVRGEYVLRVRLAEGEDPAPPAVVWEDPDHPRLARLRRILPAAARRQGPLLQRLRALSAWLASSWEHTSSARAAQYTPWDAETILAWGGTQVGHNGQRPIAMCVHYAVAMVSCCQALGIPARCAALSASIDGANGHFVAEVFSAGHGKWLMVDPNTDALCFREGEPLSISEIQGAGDRLGVLIEWGEGTPFQRRFPHMAEFIRDNLEKGLCFRCRSLWPRADFLSRPECSPPGHGSLSYCELGLVWERRDLERGFGMFRYFADSAYFDAPPPES